MFTRVTPQCSYTNVLSSLFRLQYGERNKTARADSMQGVRPQNHVQEADAAEYVPLLLSSGLFCAHESIYF